MSTTAPPATSVTTVDNPPTAPDLPNNIDVGPIDDLIGDTSWSGTLNGRPSWWTLNTSPNGQVSGSVRTRVGADSVTMQLVGRATATNDAVRIEISDASTRSKQRFVGVLNDRSGSGVVLVRGRERAAWSVSRP